MAISISVGRSLMSRFIPLIMMDQELPRVPLAVSPLLPLLPLRLLLLLRRDLLPLPHWQQPLRLPRPLPRRLAPRASATPGNATVIRLPLSSVSTAAGPLSRPAALELPAMVPPTPTAPRLRSGRNRSLTLLLSNF
jgi:hypothetical protein